MTEQEKEQKISQLARDILRLARTSLTVNLRFMDKALNNLKLVQDSAQLSFSVNGREIRYNPYYVLRAYRDDSNSVTRAYLHMILHCVFWHFSPGEMEHREYWDLACDIAVENVINELDLPCTQVSCAAAPVNPEADAGSPARSFRQSAGQNSAVQNKNSNTASTVRMAGVAYNNTKWNADVMPFSLSAQQIEVRGLSRQVKYLTAEVLYRFFAENPPDAAQLLRLQMLFVRDDHSAWKIPLPEETEEEPEAEEPAGGEDAKQEGQEEAQRQPEEHAKQEGAPENGEGSLEKEKQDARKEQQPQIMQKKEGLQEQLAAEAKERRAAQTESISEKELKRLWKEVSQQMKIDLETFSRERGTAAGSMTQNLMAVTRESYDYSSFLRKFAVLGEAMHINDDEFDYIFYTYGLQMYGKIPLVEPLEYKEVRKVREFVIALDTSGSTSHELVQKFVQKTYNILKQQESFFSKINLHIIQCDAEIQEDVKITNQEEFDDYIDHMQIRGLAGTDFRPVFSYVDYLIEKHEFTNLRGLIYFTDGYGVFPRHQPSYPTAIIYIDEGYENPQVPPWAIKLVLREEEI